MKKKRYVGLILAVALLLTLTTVAFAVTHLYRVVNWQGEVTRTIEPTQTPALVSEHTADMDRHQESLYSFMAGIPDDQTVFAWYNGDDGAIERSDLHKMQKRFSSMEEFFKYASRVQHLTVPSSWPKENVKEFYGKVFMECKAFGKYDLIDNGQSGSMRYNRFRIDESSAVATGYDLSLSMENGTFFIFRSELMSFAYEEPISLREGETAQKVSIEGMDALLITAEDPEYPDGLIMQRKLNNSVQLKQLPLNDYLEESDDRNDQYEYVTIWAYYLDDPKILLEFFSAE